jgi:uncharacterized protein (TIGR03437 family)
MIFLSLTGSQPVGVVGQRDPRGTAPNATSPDGLATADGLFGPLGLFADRRDTLYIGDSGNNRVLHFLRRASVMHAATRQSGVPLGRGALAIVSGSGLSDQDEKAPGMPLPLLLAGREVVVNDEIRAPLSSVTTGRVDLQIPSSSPLGSARLAVRVSETGELLAGSAIALAASSPGLFTAQEGAAQGRVLNQDGTPNSASNPATKGGTIKVFGTGQGSVSPPVADGEAASADASIHTVAVPTADSQACLARQPSVCVAIGNAFGEIQFSGLAAGEVGTWLITVKIPLDAPSGNAVPLRAVINGAPTNIVTVAIR